MNVSEAIRARRAVTHYDPEHRLTDDELRSLLAAAALAPSSFNMQNRHFVVVTDPAVKESLKAAAWGQEGVGSASAVFVITGNDGGHRNRDRYLRDAAPETKERFESLIPRFYEGDARMRRDEDCRSVALAAMNLMLAATELGFGSCPMVGFDPEQVSQVLGLPADHAPLMLVTVGRGIRPPRERMGLLTFEESVSVDRFGNHPIAGEPE